MTIISGANYAGFCSDGHILANLFNVFVLLLCAVLKMDQVIPNIQVK